MKKLLLILMLLPTISLAEKCNQLTSSNNFVQAYDDLDQALTQELGEEWTKSPIDEKVAGFLGLYVVCNKSPGKDLEAALVEAEKSLGELAGHLGVEQI